jgi:protoporphyrinogen oxidase
MTENIVIIGGGLAGLAAAEKLADKFNVTLLEADDMLGGMAKSFYQGGKWIPITYHHVMKIDKVTQEYIEKFGLKNEMLWNSVDIAFWFDGKGYPLIKPFDIFGFKPLGIMDKARMAKFGLYCLLKKDWEDLRDERCDEWLSKMVGKNATNILFRALADIKFGTPLSSINTAWLGNRLHESVRTSDKYGCLKIGFHEMIERIAKSIMEKGGVIKTNTRVVRISGNVVEAESDGKRTEFIADKIITTIPPQTLAPITDLPDDMKNRLNAIRFKPVVCLVGGSKHDLTKYYWNVCIRPRYSFGGIFNHTKMNPSGCPDNENVYYVFTYLDEDSQFFELSEEEIKEQYINDLKKMMPEFDFTWTRVFKIRYSNPVWVKDFENLPIKISDRIYLAGVYKEFPNTRTMNSAISSGVKAADLIIKESS